MIICGDLYDRGFEAVALQEFVLNLIAKDQIILIKGNHEDLALDLLNNWHIGSYNRYHHHTNGTIDIVCQLTGNSAVAINANPVKIGRELLQNPYIQTIIPAMLDYYETEHYIFTLDWIPCTPISISPYVKEYVPIENWRDADSSVWDKARWINGMEAAHAGCSN